MNTKQYHALSLRDTDVTGAIERLSGDEEIYTQCLKAFLDDPTTAEINHCIEKGLWDDAFTAAHALKGVAGNMGFVPLMHSVSRLVVLIRSGRLSDIPDSLEQVNSSYRDIIDGIKQFFAFGNETA